ncbi:Geranylgeranyl transferase type-1 subunit beta [Sorochytrium milnesiophthora]
MDDDENKDRQHHQLHVRFLRNHLRVLPQDYTRGDTSRMSLLYFCLTGLDTLGAMDILSVADKRALVEWIYAQQVLPNQQDISQATNIACCGFRGGSFTTGDFDPRKTAAAGGSQWNVAHLAATYPALVSLLVLGDDLSRVNRQAVTLAMKQLQQEDGSFVPSIASGHENDPRAGFCAAAVSYILDDWSGMDRDRAANFLMTCLSYDYGFGGSANAESHGGYTYCAVAALKLMSRLDVLLEPSHTVRWCLMRQETGFSGRIGKPVDTCYSFWIGATLASPPDGQILDAYKFVGVGNNIEHLLDMQTRYGGFGKDGESLPDLLHSSLGLAALSLSQERLPSHSSLAGWQLEPIVPELNITVRSWKRWRAGKSEK